MTESHEPRLLSETELEILQALATGATNREIAYQRGISEATVKKHVTNINAKLGTANRTEALRRAIELGLVSVAPAESAVEAHSELVRQLAREVVLLRQRTRRTVRLAAAASLVVLAVGMALVYAASQRATAVVQPTPKVEPSSTTDAVWVAGRDLPTARRGLALVAEGAQLYAIGGEHARGVLAQVLRYDPAGPSWQARSPKPTPVRDIGAVMIQGRIVVPGGCDAAGRALSVVEAYDPRLDRWTTLAPLPEPRCGYALVALQGQVYLFGGRSSDDPGTASAAVYRYDPTTNSWQTLAPMPLARADLAAAAISPSRIHVLGGRDASGQPQANHWAFEPYNPVPWTTEAGPPLPQGRAGLVAAAILGRLYVIGGGWDRRLADGTLVWDSTTAGAHWQRFSEVRGSTPQRGAAIAAVGDQWLYLAGGEADGRLLAQTQSVQVVWRVLLPPLP